MSEDGATNPAAQLRQAFDETFARPVVLDRTPSEDVLLIRAGDGHFALRSRETAGILRCPPLTAMPSDHGALCGIAGVRGTLMAVYDLAKLAGQGGRSDNGGWLVVSDADRSAGLRFDELLGYRSVPATQIHAAPAPGADGGAREVTRIDGVDRTVISIPALLANVGANSGEE